MSMRSATLLGFQPLRLSSVARNPQLRVMASAVRSFQTGRSDQATASYIKGTVNEPTSFPEPNAAHGSHHWAFERTLSVALVPLIAAGMAKHGFSALLDSALCLTLIVHSHIGFDACLVDYLHKRKFPIVGPIASLSLKALTLSALYGAYEFNTNDVGLTEAVARLWTA